MLNARTAREETLHHYHAFGLRIASELELPELHPGDGPADVSISVKATAAADSSWVSENWVQIEGSDVHFLLEDMHFTVRDGCAIEIEAPASKPRNDVRIWLLGTVMAALLHQRGYLPIHANLIALPGGRAAAFAGVSGAGKSTLAAWIESRGHDVLADDLCAIRTGEGGPRVFEGIPRMKLWSETMTALGRETDGLERVATDLAKFHVPLGRASRQGSLEPLTLERIYLLERAPAPGQSGICRLSGVAAAEGVLANAFRWGIGQHINRNGRSQFDQCLSLARETAVFRWTRQWDLGRFGEEAEAIERHLAEPLESRAA